MPCTTDEDCLSRSCSLTAEIDGKNVSICKMINALDINNVPFDRLNAQFLQVGNLYFSNLNSNTSLVH